MVFWLTALLRSCTVSFSLPVYSTQLVGTTFFCLKAFQQGKTVPNPPFKDREAQMQGNKRTCRGPQPAAVLAEQLSAQSSLFWRM